MHEHFRVLLVCSGNVCRSPVAERLLQAALDRLQPGQFAISSAGTSALVGESMTDLAANLIWEDGGNTDGFLARQLTREDASTAHLVLGLSRAHRSSIVQLAPSTLRRAFTLREFGRMAEHLTGHPALATVDHLPPLERWKALVSAAPLVRPKIVSIDESDDDVTDPYRRNSSAYHQMSIELRPAVEALVAFERHYSG